MAVWLVLGALLLGVLWQVRKVMRQPKRLADPSGLLRADDRKKHGAIDGLIERWNLPWRSAAFRRDTPPHPDLLWARYLANLVTQAGAKTAASLPSDVLHRIYLIYLAARPEARSTPSEKAVAKAALAALDPAPHNAASRRPARISRLPNRPGINGRRCKRPMRAIHPHRRQRCPRATC